MAMPTFVSRRCTRMPSGMPTSVKPKQAKENAICRCISTRSGSVKFFRCFAASWDVARRPAGPTSSRSGGKLEFPVQIVQFVLQLPERHVADGRMVDVACPWTGVDRYTRTSP